MTQHPKKHLWRGAAAVLAGAMLAMGAAIPASAAPLVNPAELGSITVHKFDRPDVPAGLPNNGTEVDTTGLAPIAGVTFAAQQVNAIDLSTNAGWANANGLSADFDPADPVTSITDAGFTLGAAASQTTIADGTAVFGALPVGLYLITETSYPSGVTPAAPFLVSVPLTDPNDNANWLYDVHVYPKNSATSIGKTVQDAGAIAVGDEIGFTIVADIPNEDIIDGYRITDTLDPKLDYVGAAVTLTNGVAITAGTDYTVVHVPATNTVTVEFTPAGRAILAANQTTTVTVVLATTVNAVGEIENTALLYPNAPSFDILPGEPGGPVVTPPIITKWGGITFQKVDPNGATLAGAEFSVYANETDARAGTNPIELDGATVFEVAADGTLTVSGLRYSDWANGAAVAIGDAGYLEYFLVEVTAPTGYELLAEPISFVVTAASTAVGIDVNVVNVPSNAGFTLPLTGGSGTLALYIGGGLLLVGAAFFALRARRATA